MKSSRMFDGMAEGQMFHCFWTEKLIGHQAAHHYSELVESTQKRTLKRQKSIFDLQLQFLNVRLTVGNRAKPNFPIARKIGLLEDIASQEPQNDLFVTIYGKLNCTLGQWFW